MSERGGERKVGAAALPPVPRFGERDYEPAAAAARRALAERAAGRSLPHLGGAPVPGASARGKIENLIGYAQVPVGLAGPLAVVAPAGAYEVYVPMATTEGALVASYSRGMKLLAAAGGARARVVAEGLTQCPVLVFESAEQALRAAEIAAAALPELVELVAGTTVHGRLRALRPEPLGRRLVLALTFTTGDAIGINMAARAAELCSAEIARRSGAAARYVHGQDVEKRSNARALLDGRGRSAVADAVVPRDALVAATRASPEDILAIHRCYTAGYARLGTHNWTVQAANGLAAVMLACGQDVAYLVESATGFLDFDVTASGDLYACVQLPSLLVGTVGGGSGQGTAAECLDVLGCRGDGGANRLAEILAATVLAGDLSLLAAFCAHEFVAAHERLGRNRPERAP